MSEPKLEVVKLPVIDLRDVAGGLRKLADRIEAGECSAEAAIVTVIKPGGGNPEIYGYGPNLDPFRLVGMLQLGVLSAGRTATFVNGRKAGD